MNADGKIYIIITDKLPGGMPGPGPAPEPKKSDEMGGNTNSLFAHWARNKLLSTAKHAATTAVMYSINNIGNFTGDYITQTHINDTISVLRTLEGIGSAALSGFAVGGPVGAVVGAALGVINTTISTATNIHSAKVQNRKINYEIEQLRNRAGLNQTRDGSRGTEN